jgi:predicted outer membrane repeat protein
MLAASRRRNKYRLDKWGHQHMLRKIAIGIAGPAAGALAAVGLYAVPAEAATTHVPCSAAVLASAVGSAASGETLSLAPYCTYRLTAALPTVSQNLTILGNGATLQRSYAPATPAFTILSVEAPTWPPNPGATLAVTDLNFTNGASAIAATGNGNITVQGGTFTGNHAANGGAINSTTGQGSLTVTGATFTGNTATQAGGAIYTSEAAATTTVTGSTFIKNTAGSIGGAIYNFFDMNVADSTFVANQAEDGGAIFNNAISGDNLADVSIHGNTATQDGGGVDTFDCILNVTDSQIYGNQADSEGGGLYQDQLQGDVGLALTGTSVHGNTAQDGAGIYADDTVIDLKNSTVSGNAATADGGAIYNDGSQIGYGNVNLNSSTISANRAGGNGGGIYNTAGTVDASSTPVEFNMAGTGGGGVFDGPGPDTVALTTSPVRFNMPDNCEPGGTITGCTG